MLVNAEPVLREPLAALTAARLLRACIELDPVAYDGAIAVVVHCLSSLARRVRQLDEELRDLNRRLTTTVQAIAPDLLELRGLGVDSAATFLIVAGDNPYRLASQGWA